MTGQGTRVLFNWRYSGFSSAAITINIPNRDTFVETALTQVDPTENDHLSEIRIERIRSLSGHEEIWNDYDYGAALYRRGVSQVTISIRSRNCLTAGRVMLNYWS